MRIPLPVWLLPLAVAGGFTVARLTLAWQEEPAPVATLIPEMPATERAGVIAPVEMKEKGARLVPEMVAATEKASVPQLRALALGLLKDSRHRGDLTLWGPLLARWAELDGSGLISFVRKGLPAGERSWLEGHAWYAWGAADPHAAAQAGRSLLPETGKKLIAGMVEKDARLAVEAALKMPDAQFNLYGIQDRLSELAPSLATELLPRAVYDGMRQPLQKTRMEHLLKTDPAAALAEAKKTGVIGHDPVPEVMARVAQNDPVKASALLAEMPSSRSRALSSLALAKAWAAQDAPAALTWVRETLNGPVKQSALLEVAAASGGPDPAAALRLVTEAGWTLETNFHQVTGASVIPSEVRARLTPVGTAAGLLKQIAVTDAATARHYLEQVVPEEHRSAVAAAAGISK